jgi:hypothetical protein
VLNHSSREPSGDNIPCPRRQKTHASLPPTPSAPAFFLHAHLPPRAVSIPVCLRPSPGNLFITLSFPFGRSNIPSPARTIPLLHEVRFFVGGGASSSTGTTAQRLRAVWSVSGTGEPLLFHDLAKPALYIYLSSLSPRLGPYPPRLPPPPTSRRFFLHYGYSDGFPPDMTTRGSPIATGPALRNAGQILGVFCHSSIRSLSPHVCLDLHSHPTHPR